MLQTPLCGASESASDPGVGIASATALRRGRNRLMLLPLLPAGLCLLAVAALPADALLARVLLTGIASALAMMTLVLHLHRHRNRRRLDALARHLAAAHAGDPDVMILTDRAGQPLAGNTTHAGATPNPADLIARHCAEPGRLIATMRAEALAQGHARRRFARPSGTLRLVVHTAPLRAGGDVAAGSLLIWRLSTEAVPQARPMGALGLPLLSIGADGRPIHANRALRALCGVSGDEAEPPALSDIDVLQVLARRLAEPDSEGEGAGPLPVELDGGTFLAHPVPAEDGQIDLLLLPAPAALPEPAAAPALAPPAGLTPFPDFEDIPVALMLIGADGRIRRSNRLARALLDMEPGSAAFFSELVEGLGRPVADWLADARAGRALNRPEVLRAIHPAQETFVQIILRRTSAAGADLFAVISDATEMKSLEARFVQSQKMQAIGQLAGGVAHDFNNLLTAISGHCDLLLMNRDYYDPEYDDLMQIHQNANRAAALVRQLLAFSRKQTMKPEMLPLESLLEDLAHLLTRLVGERISLSLVHDRRLGPIWADRRQMEQVILNLVVNARDAMPMGGEIRIETRALTLAQEQEHGRARLPAGDYAVIRVHDEGIGIPSENLDKIFEPFFTTKKLGDGTGLGLSTAYGIVKQMGGYIFADSTEGTGTEFTLYFAAHSAVAPATDRPAADGPAADRPAADRPAAATESDLVSIRPASAAEAARSAASRRRRMPAATVPGGDGYEALSAGGVDAAADRTRQAQRGALAGAVVQPASRAAPAGSAPGGAGTAGVQAPSATRAAALTAMDEAAATGQTDPVFQIGRAPVGGLRTARRLGGADSPGGTVPAFEAEHSPGYADACADPRAAVLGDSVVAAADGTAGAIIGGVAPCGTPADGVEAAAFGIGAAVAAEPDKDRSGDENPARGAAEPERDGPRATGSGADAGTALPAHARRLATASTTGPAAGLPAPGLRSDGGAGGAVPVREGGATVLLVEDEAPVRAFAARALRLQGYRVIEAESGEQALQFLQEDRLQVDIFVSDVIMPGLDGPGWVARALAERPQTPVVFMSGYTEDSLSAALSRTPGAVFLDKPFSLTGLCQTIERRLQGAPGAHRH